MVDAGQTVDGPVIAQAETALMGTMTEHVPLQPLAAVKVRVKVKEPDADPALTETD